MTARDLIAEYILQQIKVNDLVEIELDGKRKIKGYVLDRDVFQNKPDKQALREKLYGFHDNYKPKITIQPLHDKDEREEKLKESFIISFGYLPNPRMEIYPEQIVSIKKIDQ